MRFGVSYFGVRDPRHARRDLDEIARAGFAAVTHTLSEHDLRWHLDDVGRLVEETRARGLEAGLDPWGVGGIFGGEAYSELALVDPTCRQVDAEGRSLPAACPHAPAARALVARWARAAASLGPDVLFWDEPHFHLGALLDGPARPACRCGSCREAWRARTGDPELPPEGEPELAGFRTAGLVDLLHEAMAAVPEGTTLLHSLCLLPRAEFTGAGSDDWAAFAALPGLGRLATDPYWMDRPVDPVAYVRTHAEPLVALARDSGREAEIWLQGIRIPAGREEDLARAVEAVAELGADRVAFWSFRGTERMASLACGDPDAAWATMVAAARRHGAETAR